jgi:CpeT/CpcT family (DUF1001)
MKRTIEFLRSPWAISMLAVAVIACGSGECDALLVQKTPSFLRRVHLSSKSAETVASDPCLKEEAPRKLHPPSVWETLLDRFQGDFDNYAQVLEDRAQGFVSTQAGGQHEHIHCTLVPISTSTRLAAFYFDGQPTQIFRFRFYSLHQVSADTVDTVLYTIHPQLEAQLRQTPDPLQWPRLFAKFREHQDGGTTEIDRDAGLREKVQLLPNCDVRWSRTADPIQHFYLFDAINATRLADPVPGLHAVMVYGSDRTEDTVPADATGIAGVLVPSQNIPGRQIRIRDQLSLYDQILFIHDRGHDPHSGAWIYGNQRHVPYRLERVTTFNCPTAGNNVPGEGLLHRAVVGPSLAWTLGQTYRTVEEYGQYLQAMGGPTSSGRRPQVQPPSPDS